MMASNAELHSLICILQLIDLSPETALTVTAVARFRIFAVIKEHPNYYSNIYILVLVSANKI